MNNALHRFFARQTLVVRLIGAITIPLGLFIVCCTLAQWYTLHIDIQTGKRGSDPFDLTRTGLLWLTCVLLVGKVEHWIWQPPTDKP